MHGGSENLDLLKALLEVYRIRRTVVSSYHSPSSGLVERGYALIINSLANCKDHNTDDWIKYLPLALWADRISVRRSTQYSEFELVCGRECLLPVQLMVASWSIADWDSVKSRKDLSISRMRQLYQGTLEQIQAADNRLNSRKANKVYFDEGAQI